MSTVDSSGPKPTESEEAQLVTGTLLGILTGTLLNLPAFIAVVPPTPPPIPPSSLHSSSQVEPSHALEGTVVFASRQSIGPEQNLASSAMQLPINISMSMNLVPNIHKVPMMARHHLLC
jgi:hypothetical protein